MTEIAVIMDECVPDAVNWVGEKFGINEWSLDPENTVHESSKFDVIDWVEELATEMRSLEAMKKNDVVEHLKRGLVESIFSNYHIESLDTLEEFLLKVGVDADTAIMELKDYANFEMLESYEQEESLEEAEEEPEDLVDKAFETADANTSSEDRIDNWPPEVDEEEAPEIEETIAVEGDEGPRKFKIGDMDDMILSFADEDRVESDLEAEIKKLKAENERLRSGQQTAFPWKWTSLFWNEDIDLARIVKEDRVADVLRDKLLELEEAGHLTTQRQVLDSLFMLISANPAPVSEIMEIYDRLV
jgi:hypothetical protein